MDASLLAGGVIFFAGSFLLADKLIFQKEHDFITWWIGPAVMLGGVTLVALTYSLFWTLGPGEVSIWFPKSVNLLRWVALLAGLSVVIFFVLRPMREPKARVLLLGMTFGCIVSWLLAWWASGLEIMQPYLR